MRNRLCGIFLISAIFLGMVIPARAQTSPGASLSQVDIQNFPLVEAFLVVKDEGGRFVHALDPNNLTILENGKTIPARQLDEITPGVQFVAAINPGPSFALRNSRGVTRAGIIQQILQNWANNRLGSNLDDLSLVITNRPETTHVKDPIQWLKDLALDELDLRQAVPSLDTLMRAVDIAADSTPRPGMGQAVLFITPPLENQTEVATQSLVARAQEQGVSIFIGIVPAPGAFFPNSEKQFQQIAQATGGQIFVVTDEQPALDLETLLSSFRSVYRVTYDSQIRASGSHQLAVDLQLPSGPLTTPIEFFDLKLLPPEPAFVSPPLEIDRSAPLTEEGAIDESVLPADYLPTEQEIQILVAFPDERIRPLTRTSLIVDGVLVQENRQPPYDRFSWYLKDFQVSGAHTLRVEAEDNLGLVGTSIERLVQVTIQTPETNPWAWVFQNAPVLSLLGALVAGSILLLVLLLGGRLRPQIPGRARAARRKADPVTQPVPVKSEAPSKRLAGWANQIHWPQRHIPPKAIAFLSRISEADSQETTTPIPVTADEITLGSDPNRATLVLKDPSVEGLHARLVRKPDETYRLIDEGSIAGTWINYSPVSREGATLENGDLVHIGRVGFRFTSRQPGQVRKAVITLTGPEQKKEP